jgi:hypothetical protein
MEIFGTILFCIALIGWLLLAKNQFETNNSVSLFVGVQLLILTIYLFSLFNILLIGYYLVEIIGITTFTLTLIKNLQFSLSIRTILRSYFCLPLLAFTITIPRDFRFTMSDEFPSWAANIKTMFYENNLGGIKSATRDIAGGFYQGYPPFQQLFQYLFLKNTSWSESNVQTAQNILTLTLLLGAVAMGLKSQPRLVFPAWIGSITIYFLFGFTMSNLLADGLLAVQFAACLVFSISNEHRPRDYLLQGIFISNLILIKPTGFVLAISAMLLTLNTLIVSRHRDLQLKPWKSIALFLAPPCLIYLSWDLHLRKIALKPGTINFHLTTLTSEETRTRWINTWSSYKSNFFGSLYGQDNLAGISSTAPRIVQALHLSLFAILAILAAAHFFLAATSKPQDRDFAIKNAFLVTGLAVLYQFFLLFLYMFFFGEYEGIRSAALVRYSGSFFLGWTLLVLLIAIVRISEQKYSRLIIPVGLTALIIASPTAMAAQITGHYTDTTKLTSRLNVEKLVPETLKRVPKDAKVYYVYQQSDGFEKYIFSYLILPLHSNWTCPSLGKPYSQADVWTCDTSLKEAIKGYDFLAVGNADSIFWNENIKYLDPQARTHRIGLYKIEYSGKNLKLVEDF